MIEVAQDYGAMLLGGLLAFSLSGCVSMQFVMYWRLYPCESWHLKSLVIATWLLDLCHSAFLAIALWDSIIVPYDDMYKIDKISWSVGPAVELTAMITFLVQSFFAYRIYRLQNKRLAVVIPIIALALFRLVAASISMGEMILLQSYTAFARCPFPCWLFTLGLTLSAFVDIIITAFLCYLLRQNRTTILSTNRIIDTLTLWTIRNGLITSAATIATLICWLVMPQNRIYIGLHFIVAKLYANSLLATLNARQHRRDDQQYNYSDHPLSIVISDDWENVSEALRFQHGISMQLDPCQLRGGGHKTGAIST
ncbi:hypothetical protein DFH29DRAFT_849070 [Suillus ampliporus]|nr:hypothetical protein DFH29DRAFT_849070 [Suillus ampliporus]